MVVYRALAIIGDAAHVISPMTGSDFTTGVDDAMLLANMLASGQENEPISSIFLNIILEDCHLFRP